MKSVIGLSLINARRGWLGAPGEEDPRADDEPPGDLEGPHLLRKHDQGEERTEERLEVRVEGRPGRPDPVDGSEPHDVREDEREEEAVDECPPRERAEVRPVLANQL